ncbi:MAG: helix-turn-helix domain-containing protein [Terriglobales bacterium]
MAKAHGYLKALLGNLRTLRERAGLTESALEERLILGPGWVRRFETGETVPSIDMLLAILQESRAAIADLLQELPKPEASTIDRCIFAEESGPDTIVHFRYANFDAEYGLPNSTVEQFELVIKTLRDGLSRLAGDPTNEAIKTDAVAKAFLTAVQQWPHANPSDLWGFIIYRAYCDPYNHPARFARLDFAQSWKRTGGWALEQILVRHYGPFLRKYGVNVFIADAATKQQIVQSLTLKNRIEADKIDVVLTGETRRGARCLGVIHVKASFAERRTDDVPLSQELTTAGYTSPLWTLDCKSMPNSKPINRGELGGITGRRSAKRKDIEDEGYFTGCFSYNRNTLPSSTDLPAERRIYVCDFSNPDDEFSRFIIARWRSFRPS